MNCILYQANPAATLPRRLRHKPLCASLIAIGIGLAGAGVQAQTINLTSAAPRHDLTGDETVTSVTVQNGVVGVIAGTAGSTLTVSGATSGFRVGGTVNGASQTLDMSNLSNFTFDNSAQNFSVGGQVVASAGTGNTSGTLTLASGSNVITARQFGVGDVGRSVSSAANNVGVLNLGQSNHINADTIQIGNNQSNGTVRFAAGVTNGELVLRGTDGASPVAQWNIGAGSSSNYTASVGNVDLRGGTVDASVTNLLIGQSSFGTVTNSATGTLTLGDGRLDATAITLGKQDATNSGAGRVSGTLTINNAAVTAQTLTLGDRAGRTGSATATVNLNGGELRTGAIVSGAGPATRNFNWNGGTLGNIAGNDATVSIPTITLAAGGNQQLDVQGTDATANVSATLNGAGGFTKTGAGTLALTGNNTYAGGTTVNDGLVRFSSLSNFGTGNITLNGGGLQWASGTNADVSSQLNALGANGGVFDTNGNDVTLASSLTGANGVLVKQGAGTLTLAASNTYGGATQINAGTLAVNGSIQSATNTIGANGTLSGFGTVHGNVFNAGTIAPGAGVAGDTQYGKLTITGNYVGQGGKLFVNSDLSGDGAPSDQLVIDGGSASGSTNVVVHNTAATPGGTTGNGILVVSALNGGKTTSDAFTLQNPARSGAFDYRLFRGGVDGSNADNWYLRTNFTVPPVDPVDPVTPEPEVPPTPDLPLDPPQNGDLAPGTYPIIGPEVATYSAVQPVARELGMAQLATLDQRSAGSNVMAGQASAGNAAPSAWGRVFANHMDHSYRTFADTHAKGNIFGFQAGADAWRGALVAGHSDRVGGYVSYGDATVNVNGLVTNDAATAYVTQSTGRVSLHGTSVGAYWTHTGPSGWYVDGVVQATAYDGYASTANTRLSTKGTGVAGSVEVGYPLALPQLGAGFVLEPQAQVVWQRTSFDTRNDGMGNVDLGSTSGVSSRLGVRGKWEQRTSDGKVWAPYIGANLWRDWGGNAVTDYAGLNTVPLSYKASRVELSAGVAAQLSPRLSGYARVGYQFAVGNTAQARRDGVQGEMGVRWTW